MRRNPASRTTGATTRSPTSKEAEAERPPASTISVDPPGKTMKAASPWPTSRNVTCSRPSPREATSVRGSTRIQTAAQTAISAEAFAIAPLMPPARVGITPRATQIAQHAAARVNETAIHDGATVGQRRRELDEVRGFHQADRPRCATQPASAASAGRQRQRTTAMPAICATPISGMARSSAPAPRRSARERQRADRKQQRLGRNRGDEHRPQKKEPQRSRDRQSFVSLRSLRLRGSIF